jgi:hypothetical protein
MDSMKQNFIKKKLSLRTKLIKLEVNSINCPISFNNEIYFGRFTCFLMSLLFLEGKIMHIRCPQNTRGEFAKCFTLAIILP